MIRILKRVLAGGLILFILLVIGGWGGYRLAEALQRETSIPYRIFVRLESMYNSGLKSGSGVERTVETNRLTLREKTVYMPLEVAHYAGGIGAFRGSSILALDREGKFYHVRDNAPVRLEVAPPDNGLEALKAQSDAGRFAPAFVDFKWFRYNDVLHLSAQGREWLLASYTEWNPDDFCFTSTIARLEVPVGSEPEDWHAEPGDWQVVTRTAPCLKPLTSGKAIRGLEAAGRMAQLDGTTVIWTSGAYERDDYYPGPDFSKSLGQDPASDYGKVLEVDILTGAMRQIARGLRNPQGLAIDAEKRIWVTDHGMRGGDELNLVFEGANFGYPAVTYGTHYDRTPAAGHDRHANHDGYDQPMMAFVPSVAPGSVIALENFNYAWDGDILVGAFRGSLYRVHSEEGRPIYAERIDIGVRPRDMAMLEDGRFAVWTDFRQLVFYSVDGAPTAAEAMAARIAEIPSADLRAGVQETFGGCMTCHSLSAGEHGAGPTLHGVCGRTPGTVSGFEGYSGALSALGEKWDAGRIAAFIADPETVAPGTAMASGIIADPAIAKEIAGLLCPGSGSE